MDELIDILHPQMLAFADNTKPVIRLYYKKNFVVGKITDDGYTLKRFLNAGRSMKEPCIQEAIDSLRDIYDIDCIDGVFTIEQDVPIHYFRVLVARFLTGLLAFDAALTDPRNWMEEEA